MTSLQPLSFLRVTSPWVDSASASQKTLRNRTDEVGSHRAIVSKHCETHQLKDEVKVLDSDESKKLVESGVFCSAVSVESTLAFKANLQIPWNKMREMRR